MESGKPSSVTGVLVSLWRGRKFLISQFQHPFMTGLRRTNLALRQTNRSGRNLIGCGQSGCDKRSRFRRSRGARPSRSLWPASRQPVLFELDLGPLESIAGRQRVFGETPKTAVGTTALPKATASSSETSPTFNHAQFNRLVSVHSVKPPSPGGKSF